MQHFLNMKNLIDLNNKDFFKNMSSTEGLTDYYDEASIVELLSEVENNSEDIKMDLLDNEEKIVNVDFRKK